MLSSSGARWTIFWLTLTFSSGVLSLKGGRKSRQAGLCHGLGIYKVPVLSRSRMCRCMHRPDWQYPPTTHFDPIPPNIYLLESLDIDYVTFDVKYFPQLENRVCVYFGHGFAGGTIPPDLKTREFVIQAINEHGWPTGQWNVTQFNLMCNAPTTIARKWLAGEELFGIKQCHKEGDDYAAFEEGWYTEAYLNDTTYPNLLHFHYPLEGKVGMSALVHIEASDLIRRPKKLKFVVEAAYTDTTSGTGISMLRMESQTYDVAYTTPQKITVTPSSGTSEAVLNLDYAYQVRTKFGPPPNDSCIEVPPVPPPIPTYDENACVCILKPRAPILQRLPDPSTPYTNHSRLNLTQAIPEFKNDNVTLLPRELEDFQKLYNDTYIFYPTDPSLEHTLVILYPFLPVYKDREFREREFMIGDFRFDTGLPIGRFLDPFDDTEEPLYILACDEAVVSKGIANLTWTRPPAPAVGKCLPPDPTVTDPKQQPCYFHFHSDYFFVDCVEVCDKPKYVCAVWTYGEKTSSSSSSGLPFEFQFIANSVYYENQHVTVTDIIVPPTGASCSSKPPTSGPKEWNLLETHLFNSIYFKRSDVWLYNPHAIRKFRFVDVSSTNTLSIVDENYINSTKNMTIDECLEPATYFLEVKDNNLCLCTFWGENIVTWQTHYGRATSCTHGAKTKSFFEHFKIEFHSREVDNVKIRVFADLTPPYDVLLKDYFVLHAIYIQGMDQLGNPVGNFHRGHWVDINNIVDLLCPHSQFPPPSSAVAARYPIFDVKDCPTHPSPQYRTASVFLYQNRWRDDYPIVCAQFTFKAGVHPNVKRIQFIAFLRIEDKKDDGHAYMVELRTDSLDATDLSKGAPTPVVKGKWEDTQVTYPPLNYEYYKSSLSPDIVHWYRPCLEPVRDPEQLFTVCRHYITTPVVKDENRPDLDAIIDKYNHVCGQWLLAYKNFGGTHPYTVKLKTKLDQELQAPRDRAIHIKKCFSLQAFKTRRKNAWHVRFRVNGNDSDCDNYRVPYLREAAMVAYNEEGFPIGRPGGRIEEGGSFELFNHFETKNTGKHEHCIDDDIQLTLDDVIDNDKMAFHSDKARCLYQDSLLIPAYQTDPALFHQNWGNPSIKFVPSLMIWGNFKRLHNGFCAIWFFPYIETVTPAVTPPMHVQFVLEVQIQHEGVSPTPTDGEPDRIITVRSPKYEFHYDSSAKSFKDAAGVPDLIKEATDGVNLDASVSDSCHAEEQTIVIKKRPDDECVCELRKPLPVGSTPPPGQKPLCLLKYEFYNNIFDNRLYRVCLLQEKTRFGPENFPDDDCRTKLEYPRPPEIFPNEEITLEGTDEEEYNNTVILEPFDPTDEVYYGCGLIKRCISRFADDKVERECIRDKSCGMIVTFGKGLGEAHHAADEITIEIYAVARGWAAVGISPQNERMGEDYVAECAKEGGEVNLYNSWNLGRTNYRMRGEQGVNDRRKAVLRPVKSVFYQDKLYCKFYIKKKFTRIDPIQKNTYEYDLDELYYYITAFSHALTDPYGENEGNIRTHVFNGGSSEIGKSKFAGGERLSPLPHEARKFRLHALFMILAWMFFLTLSIFVARYFKETLVNTKIFKMDFWYFTHVVTGTLALLCLAIGIMFELSAKAGWRSMFRSNFHTYSGIVAFCFFMSEIVIGLAMKRTLEPKRPLINWVHTVMGHIAYNLAIFNMAFSDRVAYGFLACNFTTYCFVWLAVYYALHAFMSYHYCWVDYILGRSVLSRRNNAFNVLTQAPHIETEVVGAEKSRFSLRKSRKLADLEAQRQSNIKSGRHKIEEVPGKYIRVVALVTFTVITCVYTFWAVRKIVTYPVLCYDFYELKNLEEHGFN